MPLTALVVAALAALLAASAARAQPRERTGLVPARVRPTRVRRGPAGGRRQD